MWDSNKQKSVRVSRYYYEKLVGPIPEGMYVLHECDNPRCYNTRHLFLGTPTDNMQDMVVKGRDMPPKKLTQAQVDAIRADYAKYKTPQWALAEDYGVTISAISMIITGRNWSRTLPK
jgi:hypothetical protein